MKRSDFELVYKTGSRQSGRLMTVLARPRPSGEARLGIAATRRLGSAVTRNRAKRLVRELFRQHKPAAALDLVVVPRREMLDAPYARLEEEFRTLVDRHVRRGENRSVARRPNGAAADPRV